MNTIKKTAIIILTALVLFSCKHNRLNVNVTDIDVSIELTRLDKIMFETDASLLSDILLDFEKAHPYFAQLYFENIINIGLPDNEDFSDLLLQFVNDTVYRKVANSMLSVFSNFDALESNIKNGFKHYSFYFPKKPIPSVYTYFSGFNESMVVAEDLIGVSLEKYLGADCVYYDYLGIPKYKSANMNPQKIVPDIFYAWALTEFPYNDSADNLLSNMVHQGKMLYFTEAMSPRLPDSLLIGYSTKQLTWCKKNEAKMWSYLIEKRILYSSERLDLKKYIGDSPFTSVFSKESPGRVGVWLGWQIIRSFMNNNPEVTMAELMELNNAQDILNRSKYHPE
ncbi:MAG TPA: hypothetical protein VJY41_11285 [Prolixibacteraceae bacterium]|nr:hypothetical protein [Prolixibacteraceae bacterium]